MPFPQAVHRNISLGDFSQFKRATGVAPFAPLDLAHVYVKLDFQEQFENASSEQDAQGFLRSVARAAMAAEALASNHLGAIAEVQGSTLHVVIPRPTSPGHELEAACAFVRDLHEAMNLIFSNRRSRVQGWRFAVDAGRTLLVDGAGVHGDRSWVSLGQAANRPAKHLFSQLALPEPQRKLKRFHLAVRDSQKDTWVHGSLESPGIPTAKSVLDAAERVRRAEPRVSLWFGSESEATVLADAAPILGPRQPGAPTAESPHIYYGWVMRADLDGFTKRVQECFDQDAALQELAQQFYAIMNSAAQFIHRHKETMAQLPWAGDNFTAAAIFPTREAYEAAVPKRLVEASLDFEKEMNAAATASGFNGWAHGVAGGTVNGNSKGNVYLGSVEVRDRRFLVGVGQGFGRSAQAFADTNPKPHTVALYHADAERLHSDYRTAFRPATKPNGEASSVFLTASTKELLIARTRIGTAAAQTLVTLPGNRTSVVTSRPYHE